MGAFTTPLRRPLGNLGNADNPIDLVSRPPLVRSVASTMAETPGNTDSEDDKTLEDTSDDEEEDDDYDADYEESTVDEIAFDISESFTFLADRAKSIADYHLGNWRDVGERKETICREIEGILEDVGCIQRRLNKLKAKVLNGQNRAVLAARFAGEDVDVETVFRLIDPAVARGTM